MDTRIRLLLILFILLHLNISKALSPGDPVPSFCVRTVGHGKWCFNANASGTTGSAPVLLQALRREDAFSRAMFSTESIQVLLGPPWAATAGPPPDRHDAARSPCIARRQGPSIINSLHIPHPTQNLLGVENAQASYFTPAALNQPAR